jgi:hypothetical protein
MDLHALDPDDRAALERAARALERHSFVTRLADYAGLPVDRLLRALPPVASERLSATVEAAVRQSLAVAIGTLDLGRPGAPHPWLASTLAGVSGGVGGFFGAVALPVELPFTTTLMLRAIADIARHEGEDLADVDARLACLQVFALGARGGGTGTHMSYYASRALVGKLSQDAAALILERGVSIMAAPAVKSLVAEIVSRFGLVVADKLAAGAVPVLGALGGATVNAVFMDHYQRLAEGHFTMRRLERRYGLATVQASYALVAPTPLRLVDAGR